MNCKHNDHGASLLCQVKPCDSCQVCQLFYPSFPPQTPDILITLPSKGLKLYEEATIKVAFKNPLGKRLTNGKFSLHGEGYVQDATVDLSEEYNYSYIAMATM